MKYYLAIDIGASSGRHIIGYKDDKGKICLIEVYRFKNEVKNKDGHLIWDVDELFKEVKNGIRISLSKYPQIESLSIDTWGVDFVLIDELDNEILPVYAYRDNRTQKIIDEVHQKISFNDLYKITGCQFQVFNSIYQLYEDKKSNRLQKAKTFLMIPEYLLYKLTGVKVHEYTNASTMGLCSCETLDYSQKILSKLGISNVFNDPVYKPGYKLGYLKKDVSDEVGGNILVKLCASHDTASAVEGIFMEDNSPYISSGTWSLLGVKIPKAINSEVAKDANYSNEYGPNYIRFQKNIMGMWIINNLSKELAIEVPEMVTMAKQSSYHEIFDVNDKAFLSPINMKEAILDYLKQKNKPLPKDDNDLINAVYHSLAFSYDQALKDLQNITGNKYDKCYIVGGGAKNKYLNELVEQYAKKKIIALPIEATSLGNIKVQMED